MSRLDSFINRMSAQRDLLNHIRDTYPLPVGPILEVGLGNGRTYSHLRENFSNHRIIAFDRQLGAHKSSIPAEGDLVLGEIAEKGQDFIGCGAAMVHADIGTGYPDKDAVTLTWLPDMVAGMLRVGGIALCGLPLNHDRLEALPMLETIEKDRYFLYRRSR